MNENNVIFQSIKVPFEMFSITSTSEMSIENFWRIYNFPIIFLLIFISISFFFLFLYPKKDRNSIFTFIVLLAILPLCYLSTIHITDRTPASLKEAIKYEAQYNLIYSNALKFSNDNIYFIPSNFDDKSSNNTLEDTSVINVNSKVIKRVYFNEKQFPDPLSNQTLTLCSIFLFVEPGYGDLSNTQYISLSWNTHELIRTCQNTAIELGLFINKDLEILNTTASVFEYEYPKNKDEFNAGLINDNDNEHNHEEHNHEEHDQEED